MSEITILDERMAEIKRAQTIIDGMSADRERLLTSAVSADTIAMILAEDASMAEDGTLANGAYLAVKIAETVEAKIREILKA